MGRSMAHIAHQPGPVCLEGGVSRWLVGVVGLGGGAAPAPTGGAWGVSSIRVPKKNARYPGRPIRCREAMRGVFGLAPLFPGGGEEEKSRCFATTTHKPSQMCKKKTVVVHVTRW
jgi:hypothetical protein